MGSYAMLLNKKKTKTIMVNGAEKIVAVASFYYNSNDLAYYFDKYPNSARCRGIEKKQNNALDYSLQLKADYLVFESPKGGG